MLGSEFWEVVTAVGVIATAMVTAVYGYLRRRDTAVYNLPVPSVRYGRSTAGTSWIEFKLTEAPGRPAWVVTVAAIHRNWRRRRYLTLACRQVIDNRRFIEYEALGEWQRVAYFKPSSKEGVIMVHSDAPDCFISLKVALVSRPTTNSHVLIPHTKREVDGPKAGHWR